MFDQVLDGSFQVQSAHREVAESIVLTRGGANITASIGGLRCQGLVEHAKQCHHLPLQCILGIGWLGYRIRI